MGKNIDMSVNIAGVTLKNPIVTVSGTCGTGKEYADFYSPSELGAIAVKGMTIRPRMGNPVPRIAETSSGMLNCIGLQNPGIKAFIDNELPRLETEKAVVIANIAGENFDDYIAAVDLISETSIQLIEVNVSCPNVSHGGAAFGVDPKVVQSLTSQLKKRTNKPILIKLSPNVTDIVEIAGAAISGGADGLSLINTLLGMRIDIKTRRPMLSINAGGFSGAAIFPVALRMVWQVKKAYPNTPIIGMGGVSSTEDAIEMMMAGADAVGVGTAMFQNPSLPVEIIENLKIYMEQNGITSVSEITKSVIPW